MKVKNALLITIITVIIAMLLPIFLGMTNVYAANEKELGILSLREGGYGYQANGKNVWKIVEYQNGRYTYDNAIYCLKGGPGFGGHNYIENRTYNMSYNLKDLSTIPVTVKTVLPSDTPQDFEIGGDVYTYTNYNAMLWLLDNIYLPKDTKAAEIKATLYNNAFFGEDPATILLTDDDIEVIQQCALWYFTNTDPNNESEYAYHMESLPALQLTTHEGGVGPFDYTLDDLDPTWSRQTQAQELYTYLITAARVNASIYGDEDKRSVTEVPVTILDTDVTSTIVNGRCIVGPFKIAKNNENEFKVQGIAKDQDDKELDYSLLNSNKEPVSIDTKLADLVDQEFYIAVQDSDAIEKVKFTLTISYYDTNTNFWTVGGAESIEQPVVIVDRNWKDLSKTFETDITRKPFDLALRKFISNMNGQEITTRVPEVDVTPLKTNGTTANYTHSKSPLGIATGDIVTYTIRIYNEGELNGYAEEIADYIPKGLGFIVGHKTNVDNYWSLPKEEELNTVKLNTIPNATNNVKISDFTGVNSLSDVDVVIGNAKITSNKLKYSELDTENLINAYDGQSDRLNYKDVQITCIVISDDVDTADLKNIAEITKEYDEYGQVAKDRDSTPNNVNITTYPSNKNVEDDDDYEDLVLRQYDLALRKFITAVNENEVTDRVPMPVIEDKTGQIRYDHKKDIVRVQHGDLVTYTIRVFNEGHVDGYAKQIVDDIPEGLEFVADNATNKEYGWDLTTDGKSVVTNYLSKEKSEANLLKAYDAATMAGPAYKDVKVVFKVVESADSDRVLTNTAEINDDSNSEGLPVQDIDSIPGNNVPGEDDIDTESVQILNFDLSLKKFITAVNNTEITNRVPVVKLDEKGNILYTYVKTPVEVKNSDIVTYTIRVYNEGNVAGYATEVKDDVPKGLVFVPENQTNKDYGWELASDGTIRTKHLQNIMIDAFNRTKYDTPQYQDIKVAFRVDETATLPDDRVIINTAEISKDDNEYDIPDRDSTPDNNVPAEDDIDKEYVKVKYFDLSLLKWVTKVEINEDGKQRVIETGHTGLENPEPVVKVDVNKKKIKKTTIDFIYTIQVKNEGEIEGYVKEIRDDIPEGLLFIQELNPTWSIDENGRVSTTALADTLLQPGQTATVEIKLRWKNAEDNLGVKTNYAEISKDFNDSNSKDIDSTPDNKVQGEDDIDKAEVLLSIVTGSAPMYLGLVTVTLVILGSGLYFIRRYII